MSYLSLKSLATHPTKPRETNTETMIAPTAPALVVVRPGVPVVVPVVGLLVGFWVAEVVDCASVLVVSRTTKNKTRNQRKACMVQCSWAWFF